MRRVTSLVLLVTFAVLSVTGLAMTLFEGPGHRSGPPLVKPDTIGGGTVSRPSPPFFPKELHELAAYTMLVAGSVHLALNIKPLMAYRKE